MARYIDANNINLRGIAVFDQDFEALIPLSDVRKALQMTPTADVQEVRHGRWIEKTSMPSEKLSVHALCVDGVELKTMIVMLIYTTLNSAHIVAQRWTERSKKWIRNQRYALIV